MLRVIDPKHLSAEWERVRAGLVEVKKATTDDWLPEDVYMALRQGHAVLYIGEGAAHEYLGFLVLRLVPTHHDKRLEIWCAYSATSTPLMRRFLPHIKAVARNAGAGLISFTSAREEWAAAARRLGFTPKQVIYEFNLQEAP
jgi:DNA-binding transcriptional LysR family regulator